MTSESRVDLMQPWINLLWVIQFQPNFQDNSYHDWKITIWSLEGVTSLILLPCPFFSKFALACKRHTLFLSMFSLHSLEALKNFFQTDSQFIKNWFPTYFITKGLYLNNKTWILRSDNLRSMEHLDEKWPQIARVDLIQP